MADEWNSAEMKLLAHGGLALVYLCLLDGASASIECLAYISTAEKLKDSAAIARGTGNLGCCHQLKGNFPEAIAAHRQRRKMAQDAGDQVAVGRAVGNIGVCHLSMGKRRQAEMHFRERLKIARTKNDGVGIQNAYHNLGVLALAALRPSPEKGKETNLQVQTWPPSKTTSASETSSIATIEVAHFNPGIS